ncbi:MAG: hypothetical protein OK474_10065 [Thaumarchaeota archaeon]|nr:hypothetical protein [Nitrososphaerota archaeon]
MSSVAWEVLRTRKTACWFVVGGGAEVAVVVLVTVEVDVTVDGVPVTVEVVPGPVTVVVGPVFVEVSVEVAVEVSVEVDVEVVVLPLRRASVATAATIAPTTSPPPIFRKVLLEGSPAFGLSAI